MAIPQRPMRRSALIGPWGVGAIVPFPHDETLMIAGLDAWRYGNPSDFAIKDERLIKRLGVKELRWPPDYQENATISSNSRLKIPTVRFPKWHYCPYCGSMLKASPFQTQPVCDAPQWERGRICTGKYHRKMIPERFIVICPEGHVDDFPVEKWVHYREEDFYNPDKCKIRRSTGGASAGLSGVFYECTCGAKRSLVGAMNKGALKGIGYQCKGSKPWLGIDGDGTCNREPDDLRVVLRGATNVWFASTISSIHIPAESNEFDDRIARIVEDKFPTLSAMLVNGDISAQLVQFIASENHVDFDTLLTAFRKRLHQEDEEKPINEETTEEEYRLGEYNLLIKDSGSDDDDFHCINNPIQAYDVAIQPFFRSISLVPKLRETRAFVGFSRVEPGNHGKSFAEMKETLRIGDENWLPAIEVTGEGVFFEFNPEALNQWAAQPAIIDRVDRLNKARKQSMFSHDIAGDLRPEYVLIHTFAHLIINQLSFDCGYGSSSIRERIYCPKDQTNIDMYGVLIYTASGDSEGSLGGLVRQGKAGRMEDTIISAIQNACWCTSDPVCIQSIGQGPDSLNLAACHNCALLPETCCENGNTLLDRGMVIGTLDNPEAGFFSSIRDL